MNAAFFDIDYTIYNGSSTSGFYKFIADQGWTSMDVSQQHELVKEKFEAGLIDYKQAVELVIQLLADVLAGQGEKTVDQWLVDFFVGHNLLNPWVPSLFERLRTNDFKIYLVSASASPVVIAMNRIVTGDSYFASNLELLTNMYTGKVLNFLHSPDKAVSVQQVKAELQPKLTLAFGDSVGDSGMLALADQAFVYQPWDEVFKKQAEENRWLVVDEGGIEGEVRKVIGRGRDDSSKTAHNP